MKRCWSISRWLSTSSSNSVSMRLLRNVPRSRDSVSRSICLVLALQAQHAPDHGGESLPTFGFASKLFAAGFRNRVEPSLTVVRRGSPLRSNPALLSEPEQGSINRALIQAQHFFAELLDA